MLLNMAMRRLLTEGEMFDALQRAGLGYPGRQIYTPKAGGTPLLIPTPLLTDTQTPGCQGVLSSKLYMVPGWIAVLVDCHPLTVCDFPRLKEVGRTRLPQLLQVSTIPRQLFSG